ncbi:hypothetical protein, partial [Flagellimonas lutimaris]|uniref:hypothetical protein n=1 Tax=Flagellimonas lutimaris TaxID=475082 RepID=UPI003F5CC8E3
TATEAQDLTDVLTLDPSAGNNAITDVTDPTNPQDAATKNYVDGINVTSGDGITVSNPSAQEFNVAITNPVVATGRVTSGTLTGSGATISGLGGSYTITLDNPPSGDYTIQLTLYNTSGAIRTIQVTNQTATTFDVVIYNSASAIVDADWFFTVISF